MLFENTHLLLNISLKAEIFINVLCVNYSMIGRKNLDSKPTNTNKYKIALSYYQWRDISNKNTCLVPLTLIFALKNWISHVSRIPGNSRETGFGIPAFPGKSLTGNRATLV